MCCPARAVVLLAAALALTSLAENGKSEKEYETFFNRGEKANKQTRDKLPNQVEKSKVDVLGGVLKRRVEALRKTPNKQVELVFLVDSSASVGAENFFNELKFVKKLLADFTVEYNATRVAVVTFSSRNRVVKHVDHLSAPTGDNHKCALLEEQLPSIKYQGGGTYTLGAVLKAQEVLEHSRPRAAKAVFLVTDGYSNGGDPRPAAKVLRDQNVEVFTFGIQNGNVRELYDMASEPAEEHSFILDSFEEFEALARRALHEDLQIGSYLQQLPDSCDKLCSRGEDCCDAKAVCTCGTHTGYYACLCKRGYFGTGLEGDCRACPSGTYRPSDGPGDLSSCLPCPDANHISLPGSSDIEECLCKQGFQKSGKKCVVLECPPLIPPKHGYFVNHFCSNVFNAACGIRCEDGYKLHGSSIRLCADNGTWTGEETTCSLKTCPPLRSPRHGFVLCDRNNSVFETECHFTCEPGYTLVGSKKRTCLAIALWDGLPALCRSISCPPLKSVPFGSVTPAKCVQGKSSYGDVCSYECIAGFEISGPSSRRCTDPGVWSIDGHVTTCLDIEPPTIKCPKDIVLDADENEASATVTWSIPTTSDNSGEEPSLSVIPAIESPRSFDIGVAAVLYSAEDKAKNRANCSFTVTVRDVQPPTVDRCVSPPPILSRAIPVDVMWEDPIFSDNSGHQVKVWRSHPNPDQFSLGSTDVVYELSDGAGNNNTCIITITVQEHACAIPPDPMNGRSNCTESEQGVFCSLSCVEGFTFAIRPPNFYFCAYDGKWQPQEKLPFPDCSPTFFSNSISQLGTVSVSSSGLSCEDNFLLSQLEKHLKRKISNRINRICRNKVICEIENMVAECEDAKDKVEEESNMIFRRKRHLERELILHRHRRGVPLPHLLAKSRAMNRTSSKITTASNVFFPNPDSYGESESFEAEKQEGDFQEIDENGLAQTGGGRNEESGRLHLQPIHYNGGVHEGQEEEEEDAWQTTAPPPLKVVMLPKSNSEGDIPVPRLPSEEVLQNKIELEFQLTGKVSDHPAQEAETQDSLLVSVESAKHTLEDAAHRGELDISLGNNRLHVEYVRFSQDQPTFICDSGSIAQNNKCVKCPVGTFFNVVSEKCEGCPLGTYQFREGQLSCLVCPEKTSTTAGQSKSLGECKAQCLPGSFSPTGLEPCETCPLALYQPNYAQGACLPCPGFKTTHRRGVRHEDECKVACPPGEVSRTGLQPCFPCPDGYFQPHEQGKSCYRCPGSLWTGRNGATSINACKGLSSDAASRPLPVAAELTINDCFSVPCLNGATCKALDIGFLCACLPGYTGIYCEKDLNECEVNPCLNGATCEDHVNGYECKCRSGYTGKLCDQNINDCLYDPCLNGATCVDQVNGFYCKCIAGFVGPLCQYGTDECIGKPCLNGAVCQDLIAAYSCDCLPGFTGRNCETNIDDCSSAPCKNNATCIDGIASFRCECPVGFEGSFCEKDFNECEHQPCMNGATCLDKIAAFACFCPPSYVGDLCETELSSDFLLHFPTSGILDFVQLDGLRRNLDQLTICMWMKTTDRSNYGTPLSYANEAADNLLALTDYSGFVFYVNMEKVVTDVTANDGIWHLICVSWSSFSGAWVIYKDGRQADSGMGLATGAFIPAEGSLVLGQEQDLRGAGFSTPESFIGTLTLLNIWDYVIPAEEIAAFTTRCDKYHGNVRSWPDFLTGIRGKVERKTSTFCDGCSIPAAPSNGEVSVSGVKTDAMASFTCNLGYEARGSANLRCLVSGDWSDNNPDCARVSCGFPGYIANGYINGRQYLYQDSIQYVCNPTYRLIGEPTRSCQADKKWSGDIPYCEEILCEVPDSPENGEVIAPQSRYRLGYRIHFVCEEGYRLDGPASVTCSSNGRWNDSLPMCQPRSCESPPRVPHGKVIGQQTNFDVGSVVRYHCDEGFEMKESSGEMHCELKNRWEGDLPRCERVSCGHPAQVSFATTEGKDFRFGGVVTYRCERGYEISGLSSSACQANGSWSGSPPQCQPISCNRLEPPHNGGIEATDFFYGSVVKYFCNVGYELQGGRSRKCRASGEWSGEMPACVPVSCSQPQSISNGRYLGSDWTVGNTVTYSCNPGYILVGETDRVCLESGHWLHEVPSCEPVECSEPETVAHALIQGDGRRFGQRVNYHCETGFQLLGHAVRVCMEDQNWEPELPECRPIACGHPPQGENALVSSSSHVFRGEANYTCTEGFRLEGNPIRTCLANGLWSGIDPTCEIIQCLDPASIAHAYLMYSDVRFGSVVEYYCDEGYKLEGLVQRICGANGEWEGDDPECVRVRCPLPPSLPYGEITAHDTTYGSVASYSCHKGYELQGVANRNCQQDETWSGSDPRCVAIRCPMGDLALIHGRILGENNLVGATILYECDVGYHLVGVSIRTCRDDRRWSDENPECRKVECPPPVAPPFSEVVWRGHSFGDTMTYNCLQGYNLVGDSMRSCLPDGTWSGHEPECHPIECNRLPTPQNSQIQVEDSKYGSRATYSCNYGYTLIGAEMRSCTADRRWSDEEPRCERIVCPQPPSIWYGSARSKNPTVGEVAEYECDEGFRLSPQIDKVVCNSEGQWTGDHPSCQIVKCPPPPALKFGSVEGNNFTFGNILNFACKSGFRLIGEEMVKCQDNGHWSAPYPSCEGTLCPPPQHVKNGIILSSDFSIGVTITYQCIRGHQIVGTAEHTCRKDNTWSGEPPRCQPVVCSSPKSVHRGTIVGNTYEYGNSVTYSCDKGYELHGVSTLWCTENGTWSSDSPICEQISCPLPDPLLHGEVVVHSYSQGATGRDLQVWPVLGQRGDITVDGQTMLEASRSNIFHLGDMVAYRCIAGYRLKGKHIRACEESGKWSNEVPHCKPVTCNAPENLIKGDVFVTSLVYRSEANYSCAPGYKIVGPAKRECLSNGSWSLMLPSCVPVVCLPLQDIPHGHVKWTSLHYGASATYECLPGYYVAGESVRLCEQTGLWSHEEPFCVPRECGSPAAPQDGWVEAEEAIVGSTATYHCHDGFELEGPPIRTCLVNESWSFEVPSCRIVSCMSPPEVKHGYVEGMDFQFEAVISYRCEEGFRLDGVAHHKCLANKMWNHEVPKCVPLPCSRPMTPSYGTVLFRTLVVGSTVHFSCTEGYEVEGSVNSSCLPDQTWDEDPPECLLVSCPPIRSLKHGLVEGENFTYGSSLGFRCHPKYKLEGSDKVHCLANKQWSQPLPKCRRYLCESPAIPAHSSVTLGPYVVDHQVQYVCESGYNLRGSQTLHCNSSGQWQMPAPTCDPVHCSFPPNVSHSTMHSESEWAFGNRVGYSCDDGYELKGEENVFCQADGEWSESPVCEEMTCGPPPPVARATVTVVQKPGMAVATYVCGRGYRIVGSHQHKCIGKKEWHVKGVHCELIRCAEPPSIPFGTIATTNHVVGSRSTYSCMPGYRRVGGATLECSWRGVWEGLPPHCVPITCPPPLAPAHGLVEGDDYSYESALLYSCLHGYQLYGRDTRFCLEDGSWSGDVPFCKKISCGEMTAPKNGYIVQDAGKGYYGDRIRFECHSGYEMVGAATARCLDDGTWDNGAPLCKVSTCPPPRAFPPHTVHHTEYHDEFAYGDEVTFVCEAGYHLHGDLTVHCLSNGSWTQATGSCKKLSCGRPRINNGAILLGMSYQFRDRLVVLCPPGSKPRGKSILTCLQNGEWDNHPSCQGMCPHTCLNSGVCIPPGLCSCPPGYVGDVCQHAVCILPCLNGGTCIGPYTCLCKEGFTGSRCQTDVAKLRRG